ncbi:MAG: class I SAM-dependent methyltransferase [Caldilinea sp. CFX5]|nr:class I SAM-dependent methyltransferase [Caldilinea sp. CFX5]
MEAWNEAWATETGRREWLEPDRFVVELLPQLRTTTIQRGLDLGFGVGRHTILLAQQGITMYGLDAAANGLVYADAWAEREGLSLNLMTGDMTKLPYANDFFDLVITWNVIYHGTLAVIQQTVQEIERCLKPGGQLICTLISHSHKRYGKGIAIEPNTFVIPASGETSHPHHYFDRTAAEQLLHSFTIHRCEDVDHAVEQSGGYHWQIYATLNG